MGKFEKSPEPGSNFVHVGYGDISSYGVEGARTPNIDRLADEGTRFTSFYAQLWPNVDRGTKGVELYNLERDPAEKSPPPRHCVKYWNESILAFVD